MKVPTPGFTSLAPASVVALVAVAVALSLLAGCATAAEPGGGTRRVQVDIPRTRTGGDPLAGCTSNRARQVVKLSNQAREKAGLQPVYCAPELAKVAQKHANDMCAHAYLSHTSRNGDTMQDRVEKAGVSYQAIGENVALGQRTPEEVHTGWMNSPAHRENILQPVFSRLGVGFAACKGQHFWVQNFAN